MFFVADILSAGDVVLDIGCGDGFFTKHFYSARCSRIDAMDNELGAITAARVINGARNINYVLANAVTDAFPFSHYDIIVLDGALGHFRDEDCRILLAKIAQALKVTGLFVGSEALGREGADHFQFFDSTDDLYTFFRKYFKCVELRTHCYSIGERMRQEAYWRCANTADSLIKFHWREYAAD